MQLRPDAAYDDAKTCFPGVKNNRTDKFFAGEAVLLLPFYIGAWVIAKVSGADTGGYSLPFQLGVSFAALFYLILGLIFIRKLLKQYNFSESIITATCLILVLGTNLLYYATIEPSMSHIYCFSLTAIFLYYVKRYFSSHSSSDVIKASAIFSLLLIIRPTNINSLAFVPFLAGDFNSLKILFKNIFSPRILLSILAISIPILFIQGIIWKIETGHFIFWSYQGEKFYFGAPEFTKFLFSFRNGWFLYTPIMFLALFGGLIILLRKNFYLFFTFLLFFIFTVYLLSSWYAWYYGGFGKRAMADYYAAFAILIALCLTALNKNLILRISLAVVLGFLIFVNITQTRQYTNFIFTNEYMNSVRYWQLFLRTDSKYVGMFEHHPPADLKMLDNYSYQNGFEDDSWGNGGSITSEKAHNDRHSAYIGARVHTSPALALKAADLSTQQNVYAYVEAAIYMPDTTNDASLILDIQTKDGKVYSSTRTALKGLVPYYSDWENVTATMPIPIIKNSDDSLKIYFSATRGNTYIDDVSINFGVKK